MALLSLLLELKALKGKIKIKRKKIIILFEKCFASLQETSTKWLQFLLRDCDYNLLLGSEYSYMRRSVVCERIQIHFLIDCSQERLNRK